jgi:hypothetical protein
VGAVRRLLSTLASVAPSNGAVVALNSSNTAAAGVKIAAGATGTATLKVNPRLKTLR